MADLNKKPVTVTWGNKTLTRITINSYQYWYDRLNEKLYDDMEGKDEIDPELFTLQEHQQYNDAIRDLEYYYINGFED